MLRPFTGGDVDALATVFDDKEAMWDVFAIPDMPAESRAVAAHRIEESMSGWAAHGAGFWAVAIRAPELGRVGRIIGYCGYVNPANSAAAGSCDSVLEVGWAIHPAFQRRGLATPRRCGRCSTTPSIGVESTGWWRSPTPGTARRGH